MPQISPGHLLRDTLNKDVRLLGNSPLPCTSKSAEVLVISPPPNMLKMQVISELLFTELAVIQRVDIA